MVVILTKEIKRSAPLIPASDKYKQQCVVELCSCINGSYVKTNRAIIY